MILPLPVREIDYFNYSHFLCKLSINQVDCPWQNAGFVLHPALKTKSDRKIKIVLKSWLSFLSLRDVGNGNLLCLGRVNFQDRSAQDVENVLADV